MGKTGALGAAATDCWTRDKMDEDNRTASAEEQQRSLDDGGCAKRHSDVSEAPNGRRRRLTRRGGAAGWAAGCVSATVAGAAAG